MSTADTREKQVHCVHPWLDMGRPPTYMLLTFPPSAVESDWRWCHALRLAWELGGEPVGCWSGHLPRAASCWLYFPTEENARQVARAIQRDYPGQPINIAIADGAEHGHTLATKDNVALLPRTWTILAEHPLPEASEAKEKTQ